MTRFIFAALALLLAAAPAVAADPSPETLIGLQDHAGKVVYVDFWASWCVPCRKSFPWLQKLRADHGDQGLAVLTVNLDRDRAAAEAFLAKAGAEDMPVIYDPDGTIASAFGVEAMPTSYLYGRDGVLRSRHEGFQAKQAAELEDTLKELLAEPVKEKE